MPSPDQSASWLRRLIGYCLGHRTDFALAFGSAAGGALVSVTVPLIVKHVIDLVSSRSTASVTPWIGWLVVAALAQYGFTFCRRFFAGRLSLDVQYDMRADVFRALQRLDGSAQDALQTGQVVSRSITDVGLVQGLLAFLPMLVGNGLLFCIALVAMVFLSPLLTLIALAILPAVYLVALASRRDLFPANWDAQQQAGTLVGQVEAAVTGVRVVKGFGQESREVDELAAKARGLFGSRMRVVRLQSKYTAALSLIPGLGQVGVLLLGGWLALRGSITLGTFLAFSTYLAQLVGPVRMLSALLTIGQQARAGVERVLEIVDSSPTVTDPVDPTPLVDGALSLDFHAATFGYRRSDPVLRELSLSVAPGETMALIGGAGSGKSTLAMLVPRFYDVHSGSVAVGGTDVRELATADLRSAIGMVFEDSFLFSDTIAANIAYGRPDATAEQIRQAAEAAAADGFIAELPEGYQSMVGERGLTLSGGQRQRIALARALLTKPRVLLLDDATSAVDARVETDILATLAELVHGRTTLLIAHRRSTLALADRIAVLERGQLVDVGTFAELEQRCPLFRLLLAGPGDDAEGIDAGQLLIDAPAEAAALTDGVLTDGVLTDGVLTDGVLTDAALSHGGGGSVGGGSVGSGSVGGGSAGVPAFAGVTASAWQRPAADPDESTPLSAAMTSTAMPGGGPPPRGVSAGGMFDGVPPTPELLAQVAALPAATDQPDVSEDAARAGDLQFSLGRLLGPLRRPLIIGIALIGADALLQLVLPYLIRTAVDDGVGQHRESVLLATAGFALALLLGDWFISIAGQRLTGRTGERLLYTLRVKAFAHLQRLGLDYYERELGGRIMTRMTTDVDALSNFLQTGLATAVISVLTLVGVLIALLLLDLQLSLVVLGGLPILIAATYLFRRLAVPAYEQSRERVSTVNAQLQENVAGVRVAQVFSREGYNTDQFLSAATDYRDSRLRAQTYISAYFPFVQLLADVSGALVLAIGAHRLHQGSLTAGGLIAFFLYLDAFFSPVQQLSQVFDGYQQASVGMSRLRSLLRTPTSTPPALDIERLGTVRGQIDLHDVEFRYAESSEPAVRGVTLSIPAGQTIALVGETGAGKSTIVKLLARFYDPTAGAVCLDGHDLRNLELNEFRTHLGFVPQEAYLSPGSVRDAIGYGRPAAGDADIERAARAVGAHEMIAALRGGYHHQVGERGRNLSAGQRQLIALARAELVDPDVLLLDEATAALDLASEAAVTEATERLSRHRTTVVVAHRLTTAARADRIIMMDAGQVVADGSHAQLLTEDGPYAQLWQSYTAGADLRAGAAVG